MTKKIILISCSSQKGNKPAQAKDLYQSRLFKSALSYAYKLKPDKIYILSALYCLLELDKIISPYNVTLSYVPQDKRGADLKILTQSEKELWGKKVIKQLSALCNLSDDTFIVMAGQAYISPIKESLKNLVEPLKGKRQGERIKFLNKN